MSGHDLDPFFEAMKAEYDRHYPEKGDSWKTCDICYLYDALQNAIQAWLWTEYEDNIDHLVDIANLSGFLYLREKE